MAAPLPFSESELRLLQILLKRKVRFMVVGLSAATLQGAPVVTQDVDLWFENLGEPKMSRALQEVGAAYVPPSINNPPMLAGKGAELFDIVRIRPSSENPNGIPSQSPGLRGTSYPGSPSVNHFQPQRGYGHSARPSRRTFATTALRLMIY